MSATVAEFKPEIGETTVSCHTQDYTVWTHGHHDTRKFKGHLLSNWQRYDGLADLLEHEAKRAVVQGKVERGWVITVEGDISGCGWDATMYFTKTEPVIEDGRWEPEDWDEDYAEQLYLEALEDDPDSEPPSVRAGKPPLVVDGPHEATWLEVVS